MDQMRLALQEAGILRVITPEEASSFPFDAVLSGGTLSEPAERRQYAMNLLQSYKNTLPKLPEPGVSLCVPCDNLDLKDLSTPEGYAHSANYWALAASAEQCPMCEQLVHALRAAQTFGSFDTDMWLWNPMNTDREIVLRVKTSDNGQVSREIGHLEVAIRNTEPLQRPGTLILFCLRDTQAARHGLRSRAPLGRVAKLDAIRSWLPTQSIGSQGDKRNNRIFPKRLIDVLGANSPSVRLVATDAIEDQVSYAALSYCWGSNTNYTTTKSRIDSGQREILINDLPRTIQDAVSVARHLGTRYLWVDALCIVQDDQDEWRDEAAKMGDVYSNAYFTIAAHAAKDSDHGFLCEALSKQAVIPVGGRHGYDLYDKEKEAWEQDHNQHSSSPSHREADCDDSRGESSPPFLSEAFFVAQGFYSAKDIGESRLSTRGWVLQENILSSRTIHFCSGGSIYLEDHLSLQHLDDNSERDGARHRLWPHVRKSLHIMSQVEQSCGSPSSALSASQDLRRDWYSIVERYSDLNLTKPTDKLIAIGGIARKLQQLIDDRYLAGIWASHAYAGLLWLRKTKPLALSTIPRAATWSWASVDGSVQYPVWSFAGHDTNIRPELRIGVVLSLERPTDQSRTESIFSGVALLELQEVIFVNTGLRFLNGRVGKPQWQRTVNVLTLVHETRFWDVHDDDGRPIGWAALDGVERNEMDGNVHFVTCVKVASFADDDLGRGFDRGYLVLFIARAESCWIRVGMGQIWWHQAFSRSEARSITVM
ncbi:HET-domain-containing protein [Thozetella sp. PMI_491]|nr:HET-domain-containing protein [Thozetella sp. PMI_491]